MRAFALQSYDGPNALTLVDVDDPSPSDDDVLLEVQAIGVNYPDLLMTKGLYQLRPDLPFVPGCEVAGIVRSAPDQSRWQVGDRAAAFVWTGGFAERVSVPLDSLASIRDEIDFQTAAAMMVNYQTALFALETRGRLEGGESVLVLGAAGGIGTAAIQIAKAIGAHVVAGVAHEDQVETARRAGADATLVLHDDFAKEASASAPGGTIDVVVDPLGDWLFDEAIRALGPGGRILVIGFAAGRIPNLKVNRLLLRNVSAVGVAWGAFLDTEPALVARQSERLEQLSRTGNIHPLVGSRYSFPDLPQALADLDQGRIEGKGVITMNTSRSD